MGMYDVFETDELKENEGTWADYGDFRVKVASAGQGNKRYLRYAEKALKPIRRAMQAGAVSTERSTAVMSDIYAKTIIMDWQAKVGEDWKSGIEGRDGKIVAFSTEEVERVFASLPALFIEIQEYANSIANFRKSELKEDSGN